MAFRHGVCFYCRTEFQKDHGQFRGTDGPTIDHVYPVRVKLPPLLLSRESTHNKVRACRGCNAKKAHMHPLTWLSICPDPHGAADLAALLLELGEEQQLVVFALQRRERLA